VVDPCAGSFIVLEACQNTNRNFLGCDFTFKEQEEYLQPAKTNEPKRSKEMKYV
jgi:hypothetical protein